MGTLPNRNERIALTKQQARAMRTFLCDGGETSSGYVWDEGVRPWPTMRNLERKGLCVSVEYLDEDAGYLYSLTTAGADWLCANRPGLSDGASYDLRFAGLRGDELVAKISG